VRIRGLGAFGFASAPAAATPATSEAPPAQAGVQRIWTALGPALGALLVAAAALRFSTLGVQSLWYDEAFTPVHVLHGGLGATLRATVHTENSPPLFYILLWGFAKAFGTGAVALRFLSAVAGTATVAIAWAVGRELGTRRTAVVLAALVCFNPLFVWYSQEARAYELLLVFVALAFLLFLRARRRPGTGALVGWAVASALALLTHYFAIFLIVPEAVLLLGPRDRRLARTLAVASVAVVTGALIPLVVAQSGHGTQWIGHWAFSSRLIAIAQYWVLGASGDTLGKGLLVLALVPFAAALALVGRLEPRERDAAFLSAGLGLVAIAVPLVLAVVGLDYLAPRNLIAVFFPITAAFAVTLAARRAGGLGTALAIIICAAGLAAVVAVDLRPRLQRGDWHGVARALSGSPAQRAVVTVGLGTAPLQYYVGALHKLPPGDAAAVQEVDLIGYRPIVHRALRPAAPGLTPIGHRDVHGLLVYRYRASTPVLLSEEQLLGHRLDRVRSDVLVSPQATAVGSGTPVGALGRPARRRLRPARRAG
jgi:4-amino-4-deoxy-L-arabinose transferase-like glycosyltransferase